MKEPANKAGFCVEEAPQRVPFALLLFGALLFACDGG